MWFQGQFSRREFANVGDIFIQRKTCLKQTDTDYMSTLVQKHIHQIKMGFMKLILKRTALGLAKILASTNCAECSWGIRAWNRVQKTSRWFCWPWHWKRTCSCINLMLCACANTPITFKSNVNLRIKCDPVTEASQVRTHYVQKLNKYEVIPAEPGSGPY